VSAAAGIAAPISASGAGGRSSAGRWLRIVRLGLIQAALGSVVVVVTSTLNRVMVVEYSLPAVLPGALVALHYAVQMIRPRFGHGSDVGARRTPWIIGGMALLAVGGMLCAAATVLMSVAPGLGILLAILAYALVGLGAGAAGTSLLVLLAAQVDARQRAAAATIMWVLMVAGFAVTAGTTGHFLDPFSAERLLIVTACVALAAFLLAVLAVWRVEAPAARPLGPAAPVTARVGAHPGATARGPFRRALAEVWAEPQSRRFTVFVFVSMVAYSAQELILEPFVGLLFNYSIGQSARLSGLQHGAVFAGMVSVGILCSGRRRFGSLRAWTVGGCVASAFALLSLGVADLVGPRWPLPASVFALGVANGIFAVAAIGSMMELGSVGHPGRTGVRMGLWGAAQAVGFACGGLFGTSIVDIARYATGSAGLAFGFVFSAEAALFLIAAGFAARVVSVSQSSATTSTAVPI
jgi:BCD family chlorophyll transporter-like MFS transporter